MRGAWMASLTACLLAALPAVAQVAAPPPLAGAPVAQRLTGSVNHALPPGTTADPFGFLTGLPDYVRDQGWGFVLTLQNIPILEPAYWDRAIGSPYTLNRSSAEKVRQFPSAARLTFYDYYLRQLRNFDLDDNPGRVYADRGLENAWTGTHMQLAPGEAEGFFASLSQSLASRFSPEELADVVVWGLSRPPLKRTEEDWRHLQHVFFYNAAALAALVFGYQFSQNQAQMRGGRWWRYDKFSMGAFVTVRRLGVAWKPNYSGDIRFGVPGVETAFSLGGRLTTDADSEQLAMEHSTRVNWLNYFARSLGWDVYAEGRLRYSALHTNPLVQGRAGAEGRLSGRRENLFDVEGLTFGADAAARTTVSQDAGLDGSMAIENVADLFAAGFRVSGVVSRDKPPVTNLGLFVAAPLAAPLQRPAERAYQMHARLLRDQVAIVHRQNERLRSLESQMKLAPTLRPPGVNQAVTDTQRQLVEDQRRVLRERLYLLLEAKEEWRRTLKRSDAAPEGYVTAEDVARAQVLTAGMPPLAEDEDLNP